MKQLQIIYAQQPKVVRVVITEQQAGLLLNAWARYHGFNRKMFYTAATGWNVLTEKGSTLTVSFAHVATLILEEAINDEEEEQAKDAGE